MNIDNKKGLAISLFTVVCFTTGIWLASISNDWRYVFVMLAPFMFLLIGSVLYGYCNIDILKWIKEKDENK